MGNFFYTSILCKYFVVNIFLKRMNIFKMKSLIEYNWGYKETLKYAANRTI